MERYSATLSFYLSFISSGLAVGAIVGISIAAVAGLLLLAACIYIGFYRKRKVKEASLLPSGEHSVIPRNGTCFLIFLTFFLTL